ncbi:MAG: DUF4279 domain-containing protein [Lachnospiraceae bacterium]|nr:DUF4279 domain-containing protein [Lachnospiraceae bacterium]
MADIIVYLTLSGNSIDTEFVTKALDITPTSIRRNDEILPNGRLFGHTEWSYDTGLINTIDLPVVFNLILPKFFHNTMKMREIADELKAEWSILVYIKSKDIQEPIIVIPPFVIQFASEIGAEIGFDLYT